MQAPFNLRNLRLWHWRQAMLYRQAARLDRAYFDPYEKPGLALAASCLKDAKADFHIGVVQGLNDLPECAGSTAEQDDVEGYK